MPGKVSMQLGSLVFYVNKWFPDCRVCIRKYTCLISCACVCQGKGDAGEVRPSGWDAPQAQVNPLKPMFQINLFIVRLSQWSWTLAVSVSLLRFSDGKALHDLETLLNNKSMKAFSPLFLFITLPKSALCFNNTGIKYFYILICHSRKNTV